MTEPNGKLSYICPHCGQKLSFLGGTVIKMTGRLHAENFSCKTMFYVPAKLGQFGVIVAEGIRIRDGAIVEFECINGVCKRNFTTSYDSSLAEIKLIDEKGNEYIVIFNKIFGKHATFLVSMKEKTLLDQFGEDAEKFSPEFGEKLNFFGC